MIKAKCDCGRVGQVEKEGRKFLKMYCTCGRHWKTIAGICPICGEYNGYPSDGLCMMCYETGRKEKCDGMTSV